MKVINFEFDIGDEVTTADGQEGKVQVLIHKKGLHCDNKYEISLKGKSGFIIVNEDELLKGHDCFQHQRS